MDRIMLAAAIGMAIVFVGFMVGVIAMGWTRKEDRRRSRAGQPAADAARYAGELSGTAVDGIRPREVEEARR